MAFSKKRMFSISLQRLAVRGQSLGHPARVDILLELARGKQFVQDLAKKSPLTRSTISGHLRILLRSKFIEVEEQGLYNQYSINLDELEDYEKALHKFIQKAKELTRQQNGKIQQGGGDGDRRGREFL